MTEPNVLILGEQASYLSELAERIRKLKRARSGAAGAKRPCGHECRKAGVFVARFR